MPSYAISRVKIKNNAPEPVIEANDAKGGMHIAADNTARDATPSYVKMDGVLCWVVSTQRLYQWRTGTSTWVEITLGGAGSDDHYIDADTSALVAGDFACFTANDVAGKTNAEALATAVCVGGFDGTSSKVRVLGVMEAAKFSTTASTPIVGQQVYLCRADAEGGGAAAGKVTTTVPSTGIVAPVGVVKSVDVGTFPDTRVAGVFLQIRSIMQR